MTVIIYDAIRDVDIHSYERKWRAACFAVPAVLMAGLVARPGDQACCVDFGPGDSAYFNHVCGEAADGLFIGLWIVPVCALALFTFFFVVRIKLLKRSTARSLLASSSDKDIRLALIVYKIPMWSFLLYLADLAFTAELGESRSVWVSFLQNIPFAMSVVNTWTVRRYLACDQKRSLMTSESGF